MPFLIFLNPWVFPIVRFADFLAQAHASTAFQQAGVPLALETVLAAVHQVSWYSCEGLPDMVVASQGCKAGDPLVVFIFSFLICNI